MCIYHEKKLWGNVFLKNMSWNCFYFKYLENTIPQIISETFLCFSIDSIHHKQSKATLLSAEIECTSCLVSCRKFP